MRGFLKRLNIFGQQSQAGNQVSIPIDEANMEPLKTIEKKQEASNNVNSSNDNNSNNTQIPNQILPPVNPNNLIPKGPIIIKEKENATITHKDDPNRQIVVVNSAPITNKKEGFYYKKYIDCILKLKVSQPIMIQREKMKVGFDKEVLDYLFNDMTAVFKEKSSIIDQNQKELIDKINQTHEYIGIFHELNRKTYEGFTNYKKQKELMEQIDYLDIYINSLSVQADHLLEEINLVEKKINESKN